MVTGHAIFMPPMRSSEIRASTFLNIWKSHIVVKKVLIGKVCFKSSDLNSNIVGLFILVDCPSRRPYTFREDTSKSVTKVGL